MIILTHCVTTEIAPNVYREQYRQIVITYNHNLKALEVYA